MCVLKLTAAIDAPPPHIDVFTVRFIFNRLNLLWFWAHLTAFTALLTRCTSLLTDFTRSVLICTWFDWINAFIWLYLHLSSVLLPSCVCMYSSSVFTHNSVWFCSLCVTEFTYFLWIYLDLTECTHFLNTFNHFFLVYPYFTPHQYDFTPSDWLYSTSDCIYYLSF